jgi:hypothetical protein
LAVDHCISESNFLNFTAPLSKADEEQLNAGGWARDRVIFEVAFMAANGTPETLVLRARGGTQQVEQTCAGPVMIADCYLVSAIAEYPVIIDDSVLSLTEAPHSPKLVAQANNTAITNKTVSKYGLNTQGGGTYSTLAGVAVAAT